MPAKGENDSAGLIIYFIRGDIPRFIHWQKGRVLNSVIKLSRLTCYVGYKRRLGLGFTVRILI